MGQIVTGLRAILSSAPSYNFFQNLTGARGCRKEWVRSYVRAAPGQCILDIGCGTAEILECLPEVSYYGFDPSEEYIESARRRFGKRAMVTCANLTDQIIKGLPKFDLVLAIGVLHHLSDPEAANLFGLAKSALKDGGRLVTLDPCFVDKQSRIARFLIESDRGQNVRDERGYRVLAEDVFASVNGFVRHDLLRIPYTHLILECAT